MNRGDAAGRRGEMLLSSRPVAATIATVRALAAGPEERLTPMPPRVLVLFNEAVLPPDHPNAGSENDVLDTVEFVTGALTRAGYETSRVGLVDDPRPLLDAIHAQRPDVVFNLFEGTVLHGQNEAFAAALLEWVGVPFTGCPAQALLLGRHKALAKHLLQGAGLPTAPFFVVAGPEAPPCPLPWPVIVKPGQQDASEGIEQESVVTDQESLQRRVAQVWGMYREPILVEQFVRGREIYVALVEDPEPRVMMITETLFIDDDPAYWPIVTYDAKWRKNTRDFDATPVRCPAEVSDALRERLSGIAIRAFRLLGCRDYARVDFRVAAGDKPFVLEVNPNPDFNGTGGFVRGLEAAGIAHADFAVALVERARRRS